VPFPRKIKVETKKKNVFLRIVHGKENNQNREILKMTDLFRKVEIIVEEKEDDGSEGEEECLPSRTWRATKKREEGVREKETDQQQQQQEPESDVDVEDVIVAVDRPAAFSMSPPLPALHRSTTTTLEEMPIHSSLSETEEIQVGGGFRHSDWYVSTRSIFKRSDTNNEL